MGCTESKTESQQEEEVKECTLLPGYTLSGVLGEGAFGTVFSARDKKSGQKFAAKVFQEGKTSRLAFEEEAYMLRQLQHPRVLHLHCVVSTGVNWALITDVYRGGSLHDIVQQYWKAKGRLSLPILQNVTRMMAEAVEHLHYLGIVHRDLKQTNFLADRRDVADPKLQVVLCDVATAAPVAEDERLEERVGTSVYWSPEVWEGSYGMEADVWAFGVIMYSLIFSRFPYNNYKEIRAKSIEWPAACFAGEDAKCLTCGLLQKRARKRLTMTAALDHAFLRTEEEHAAVDHRVSLGRTSRRAFLHRVRAVCADIPVGTDPCQLDQAAEGDACRSRSSSGSSSGSTDIPLSGVESKGLTDSGAEFSDTPSIKLSERIAALKANGLTDRGASLPDASSPKMSKRKAALNFFRSGSRKLGRKTLTVVRAVKPKAGWPLLGNLHRHDSVVSYEAEV